MEPQIQTYYKLKKNACKKNIIIRYNSKSYLYLIINHFNIYIAYQTETMILLEDSDLHAVINCLKFKSIMYGLHKIWIQESIAQTFMWHFKKYFGCLYVPIHIFQLKQKLITCYASKCNIYREENKITITSIWSEDIIAAKNLARTLNVHFLKLCNIILSN